MKAPFPWFGGKSRVAHLVWDRFGNVPNYVEPFAGSLAVLLLRPHGPVHNETVNDKDAFLSNFWRALAAEPSEVARWADWPVNESDLHARHRWLVDRAGFRERMLSDPDYFDAKIAGWWVWGISQWIGSGWCSLPEWTGQSGCERSPRGGRAKRVQIKRGGCGVHRAATAPDVWKCRPNLEGGGISRQLPNISGDGGASGRGVHAGYCANLFGYFAALSDRLRRTRVCCGDWKRILGPSPTTKIGLTGVFLDPPYSASRAAIYNEDAAGISALVRDWAIEHASDTKMRIALCGYGGEHELPSDWECVAWKANGGYGNQGANTRGRDNAERERIWFSPHCLKPGLFSNQMNEVAASLEA